MNATTQVCKHCSEPITLGDSAIYSADHNECWHPGCKPMNAQHTPNRDWAATCRSLPVNLGKDIQELLRQRAELLEACKLTDETMMAMHTLASWVMGAKYRTWMQRHDGSYRTIDECTKEEWNSDTVVGLCELMGYKVKSWAQSAKRESAQ